MYGLGCGFSSRYVKPSKRFKQLDCRTSDGRYNEQKDHHADRAVLICVVDGGVKETVTGDCLTETIGLIVWRWVSSRDSLSLANITGHNPTIEREVKSILHERNQIIEVLPHIMAERWSMNLNGKRIHLSVEGGCGGTTFGLHCAVNEIQSGGRVLWASPEMPNASRFSQLFASLNIVESSRFHALNLIGAMDRCVDAIVEAEQSLPRVGLVVLDDWCAPTGRIERENLEAVLDLAKRMKPESTLLLISKSVTDVTGSVATFHPRSKSDFEQSTFEIWGLYSDQRNNVYLDVSGEILNGKIEESGFFF